MARLPYGTAAELNLDADRLHSVAALLQDWTTGESAPVPGAAMLVGRHGRILDPVFAGRQGPEAGAGPIRRDGMFLLASITKPVTYLAAMMLVERGQLNLSDPVMRYIPEFAAHHKEDTLVLHLFTHTSGMPDMLEDNAELRARHAPLSRFVEGAINAVPLFPAGTDYSYQSMGTLIVAELVRRLSGKTIHEFIRTEILDPLGLESTGLGSSGFDRDRLVRVQTPEYQAGSNFGWNSRYWQELGAPWGGMFSAPEDFAVICQLLLNGGVMGDVRLLSPATVAMMTSNRLQDQPALPEPVRRATPWGLGWRLNAAGTSASFGQTLGPRVYGHTGATGTMCWIDPDRDGFCLLFTTAIRSYAPWRLVHLSNMVGAAFL